MARPIAIFVDDLDGLTKGSADQPDFEESAMAVETLIGFLSKTAKQTNVSLIVGTADRRPTQSTDFDSLWNSAAQLQLASSISDPGSDEPPLYFAAPGLPGITLQAARV